MRNYSLADFSVNISEKILEYSIELAGGLEKISNSPAFCREKYIFDYKPELELTEELEVIYDEREVAYPTVLKRDCFGNYLCEFCRGNETNKLSFYITKDWKEISLICNEYPEDGYMLFNRLGALFNLAVLNDDACVFHGVVMNYHGKGILVMAHSGVGKTTHTNMWEEKGYAEIVNGDRCLCRCIDGTWYAYGMPWAGSSGKILNKKVKVAAIVMLERGLENMVEQTGAFESEIKLMQRIFAPVSDIPQREKAFDYIHDIATKIPVLKLKCRPDYESVEVLKKTIDRLYLKEKNNVCE